MSGVTFVGNRFVAAGLFAATVLLASAESHAGLVASYELGTGASTSTLQFDFANGNSYLYTIHWDGVTTGRDLFDIAAQAQPGYFVSDIVTFSFGDALFGQSIGTDSNAGFGTPPKFLDYWHYWVRDSEADLWESAFVGFGDRVLTNGSWDGWVFGSDAGPSAVPAPAGLAALTACLIRSRRRRSGEAVRSPA